MPKPTFREPIWRRSERWAGAAGPLRVRAALDLLVIGGGFLGLSTALHAARQGLSVAVAEAGSIGEGASGLNGGQVIPGFKYDPDRLVELFGDARGNAMAAFGATTADAVFDLIASERLDVPHLRSGWIQAAHTNASLAAIGKRHRAWKSFGADVAILSANEVARLTGARGYLGGWMDRRAGVVDPLSLVTELARVGQAQGVQIGEGVRIVSLRRNGTLWSAETDTGATIEARHVLIATNAYTDGLMPGLAQTLVPLHSFQIATAPLPPEIDATILPEGQAVSDSRRILVYYRKTADGRLVLGGRGRMAVPQDSSDWRHLERALLRLYPQLAGIAIDRRWFGRVAMTADHLPHIHEPEPGLLTLVGCQGRGVALMIAMGRRFADYLASGDREALPLPVTPVSPIPLHRFRRVGIAAAIGWYRALDAFER